MGGGGKIHASERIPHTYCSAAQEVAIIDNTTFQYHKASKKETQKENLYPQKSHNGGLYPTGTIPQEVHAHNLSRNNTPSISWYKTWWAGLLYASILTTLFLFTHFFPRHLRQQKKTTRKKDCHNLSLPTCHTPVKDYGKHDISQIPRISTTQETHENKETETYRPTIAKAVNIITAHLGSKDFDVKQFAYEMCMSTSTLYRKIKATTGLSPVELIRAIRLKEAYRMMTETNMSISEIAISCGFSTLWYFSKCFKLEFGILPTDLKKMKKTPKTQSQSSKILDDLFKNGSADFSG